MRCDPDDWGRPVQGIRARVSRGKMNDIARGSALKARLRTALRRTSLPRTSRRRIVGCRWRQGGGHERRDPAFLREFGRKHG